MPSYEALVPAAASVPGRLLILLAAALLLPRPKALLLCPLLLLFFFFPARRTTILSIGSLWVLYDLADYGGTNRSMATIAVSMFFAFATCYLTFLAARSYRALPALVQRNSQLVLHAVFLSALGAAWALPRLFGAGGSVREIVVGVRYVLPFLLWRCGYVLLAGKCGSAKQSGFFDHFFYLLPAFGGSQTPYGKGYDHLRQNRAEAATEIVRTQLSGVKLLALAWLWKMVRSSLRSLVYGEGPPQRLLEDLVGTRSLELPRLSELIAGAGAPIPILWTSLVFELVMATLSLAIGGHLIVGSLRLFGYSVFRNTYRPLLSHSVVDFWNRYYYYFKELLVEFFFFPTYVAYFKTKPKLRILAATMAAACVGNVYYHAVRDLSILAEAGAASALALMAPRTFYGFLLGLGIFVSMLRERERRGIASEPARSAWRFGLRLRAIGGVWLFYSLIHIWSVEPLRLTFGQRTRFFFSLFGIG